MTNLNGRKIGIALGGGGARGIAHLGVLRGLQNAGIPISAYAGSSMGAIIAVATLQRRSFNQSERGLKDFVLRYAKRFEEMSFLHGGGEDKAGRVGSFFRTIRKGWQVLSLSQKCCVYDDSFVREVCEEFIYPCDLSELPAPMHVCSLDLISGQAVFMNRGSARGAVRASMSIAGSFPPVEHEGRALVDPSAVFPVPLHAFLFEPVDIVIAVDLGSDIDSSFKPGSGTDVLLRQFDLMSSHVESEIHHCADLVIRPKVGDLHFADFSHFDRTIEAGLKAAEDAVPRLKELLLQIDEKASANDAKEEKVQGVSKGNGSGVPLLSPLAERPWHHFGYGIKRLIQAEAPPESQSTNGNLGEKSS